MTETMEKSGDDTQPVVDRQKRLKQITLGLIGASVLLLAIDPLVHKHGPFEIVHMIGFYAGVGLVGAGGVAVLAILARRGLSRPEDYYDR